MQFVDLFKEIGKDRKDSYYTNFTRIVYLLILISFVLLSVFSQHSCCDEDYIQQSVVNNVQPILKQQPISIKDDNDFCLACLWQNIVNSTGQIVYISTAFFKPKQYSLTLKEDLYHFTLNSLKTSRAPPII